MLFCIGLNPLSQIIPKSGYGYMFKSGVTICHPLYMDDIMLYAKNERDIDSLIHLTMEAADVKTRKLLTKHRGFHPKSNIQRL